MNYDLVYSYGITDILFVCLYIQDKVFFTVFVIGLSLKIPENH